MKELTPDLPVFELLDEEDEDLKYELVYEDDNKTDRAGREYEFLGHFLNNENFYQGLNMVTVIRRKSDGKLFGFGWWNDISKHGDAYIEANGDDFGIDYSSYVFEPVEEYAIPAYRFTED